MNRVKIQSMHRQLVRRQLHTFAILMAAALLLSSGTDAVAAERYPSLATIDSLVVDSLQLQGKVVYVDFWASWCAPCRVSFPWLREMEEKYQKQGLVIVGVSVDKDTKAARAFVTENSFPTNVVYDSSGLVAKTFKLEAMPTAFIYGRDGGLKSQRRGFKREEMLELEKSLQTLLNESPPQE